MELRKNKIYPSLVKSASFPIKPQRLISLHLPSSKDTKTILKGSYISHKSVTDIEHRINFFSKLCSERPVTVKQIDIVQEIKSKIAKEKKKLVLNEQRFKRKKLNTEFAGSKNNEGYTPELSVKSSILNENFEKRIKYL